MEGCPRVIEDFDQTLKVVADSEKLWPIQLIRFCTPPWLRPPRAFKMNIQDLLLLVKRDDIVSDWELAWHKGSHHGWEG